GLARPRALAILMAVVLIVGLATAPLLLAGHAPTGTEGLLPEDKQISLAHRRAIWAFAAARIAERPWLGWGLDSSRDIPGGHAAYSPGTEMLPLHPHDAAIQLWLELGVPGMLLGAAFVAALMRRLARLAAGGPESRRTVAAAL